MKDCRKILVTGTQRAGTTWVGRILSSNNKNSYVHEPFNEINRNIHKSPITYPYQYIDKDIDEKSGFIYSKYLDYFLNQNIKFYLNSILRLNYIDSRFVNPIHQFISNRNFDKVKIIKDPFALFSCEWLHVNKGWDIVIVLRHPAAFALSMKEKNWIITPKVFEKQTEEISHFYNNERKLIQTYLDTVAKKEDIIDSAIKGWNLLYSVIHYYKRKYPDWTIIRHEDLSLSPIDEFKTLYERLNLDYNKSAADFIAKTSLGAGLTGHARNSKLNVKKWSTDLNSEDILRIKNGTKPLWNLFYSESDW